MAELQERMSMREWVAWSRRLGVQAQSQELAAKRMGA